MDLVFVDLETTGGVAHQDRITEIAVVRCREGKEIHRWSSLINPEQPLTSFIQQLTGITDAMLENAPVFADVAEEVLERLHNAVFVAHNVRFDYGFLKHEFARLGQHWQATNVCTVKLSRRLYPKYRKHGLDQLIERHQLVCESRHRAMGDAVATLRFYQHACAELGSKRVDEAIARLLLRPSLPPKLALDGLDGIPTTAGYYCLKNEANEILYLGWGVNLYQRISSQLQDHHSADWLQQVTSIDFKQSAGELSAQLSAWQQIEQQQPYDHTGAKGGDYCSLQLVKNEQGYLIPYQVEHVDPKRMSDYYGLFKSPVEANKAIKGLCRAYQLNSKFFGTVNQDALQPLDDPECYNLKVQKAFEGLRLPSWPWSGAIVIREQDSFTGIVECHVFDHWCHLASFAADVSLAKTEHSPHFDKAIYQYLVRYLASEKDNREILDLSSTDSQRI